MPKRKERPVGFHFALELNGVVQGYFTECSGLGSESEVKEYQEGGVNGPQAIRKIPGLHKFGNITLKRGFSKDKSLWVWRQQVEDGQIDAARQNGSIVMYDGKSREVARWNFSQAWPSKISLLPPQAETDEIGSEELTLVLEYLRRVS